MSKIKILPLHPYSASPTDYDSTTKKNRDFIIKYYFIKEACKATDKLSERIDSFIIESLKKDSVDFAKYGGYYILFFKESDEINENYRYSGTDNAPDAHIDNDLLFEYKWIDKKFMGCKLYENGKVVKLLYNQKDNLFKPNP